MSPYNSQVQRLRQPLQHRREGLAPIRLGFECHEDLVPHIKDILVHINDFLNPHKTYAYKLNYHLHLMAFLYAFTFFPNTQISDDNILISLNM